MPVAVRAVTQLAERVVLRTAEGLGQKRDAQMIARGRQRSPAAWLTGVSSSFNSKAISLARSEHQGATRLGR